MSIALRIIKRIFITFISLLMIFIVGFFIWRIASSGNPKSMQTLSPNQALVSLYEQQGEEMYMFKQEQRSITSSEQNYGYFAVTDCVFIPEANQIQTVLRYNNSTLRSTAEDFSLSDVPSREENTYDLTLLLAIDLTPEDTSDNFGNNTESVQFVRVHGNLVGAEQKNIYNFRKYVFLLGENELNLKDLIDQKLLLAVYADIYYSEQIDYTADAYGTLCLYDFKTEVIPYEAQKSDIKALEEFN